MSPRYAGIITYSLFLSAALLISTALTHFVLLSFLKNGQVSSIETAVRENIILDNRREIIALLDQPAKIGFNSVILYHRNYAGQIVFGKREVSWWEVPVERTLYFDANKAFESSRLVFYYSPFEGMLISLSIWFIATMLSILPINVYVEKRIKYQQKEEESRRNKVSLEIFNYLAHDMRAPIGIFEKLLFVPPSSQVGNYRKEISEAIHRLYAMVESIRYSDVDVVVAAMPCKIDLDFGSSALSEKARKRNIQLSMRSATETVFLVDKEKLERAWINLVSNAIDFAKSKVSLDLEVQGSELVIQVIDDGPGVPNQIITKLFERGATHGKSGGTGLGLAYVRQIMRGHGGDVTYRRENNLTVFECRLPNAVQPEKEQLVENAASLDTHLVQKLVRSVAICLEPKALTQSVLAKLASYVSIDFLFTEERANASIVVSNIDEVMFEVLERDDQEYVAVAHLKCDETAILKVLKRKFNLDNEGGGSV
jgi:hypothetical protein